MNRMGKGKKNSAVFIIVYSLLLLLVLEGTCRLFFSIGKAKIPFFEPRKIIYLFYPELKIVDQKKGGTFDILLLGSSALNKRWSTIENILLNELSHKRKIKIYNLAVEAHTSLDCYYKYKFFHDRKFDLVMLYEGINEVRTNNRPASFYKWVNAYERHKEVKYMLLPYLLHCFLLQTEERLGIGVLSPQEEPRDKRSSQGGNIITVFSFRRNVENILKIANKKNEKSLLMTFAFYIPENYTLERFKDKLLDYGNQECPVEIWGKPEYVKAAILVHNEIIINLAKQYSRGVIFVDQYGNIPQQGRYFNDICHLSYEGCKKFVENIRSAVIMQMSN